MSQGHPAYANLANLNVIEDLYAKWLNSPTSVDPSWQNFFDGMQFASHLPLALPHRQESLDLCIRDLIIAYRTYGHLLADCNPLSESTPLFPNELRLENFALSEKDLHRDFPTFGLLKSERAPLREIQGALERIYCQKIGFEYMDLGSLEIEEWIQKQIEPSFSKLLSHQEQVTILKQLNEAEGFEAFLHTKYVGQKRFSLEGAETLIPVLHAILTEGGDLGVSDLILGMSHRGRLNVLANIMGKSYEYIFEEFEDTYTPELSESTGDVKYHMGFAGTYTTEKGKKVQVILSANPSHLESVDPVVIGGARAVQEQKKATAYQNEVVPVLIHGDAALAGQGVVYETMSMSRLRGYQTQGTIHIVVNNQIGYTTLPKDSRSTRYCTDIAKAFGAPVFHVNVEDPERCVQAAILAVQLRQKFGCDVFIDLVGYRKYGHNEGDEPTFTQPIEYHVIRLKKSIAKIYRDRLISSSVLEKKKAEEMEAQLRAKLDTILHTVKNKESPKESRSRERGKHLPELFASHQTKVPLEEIRNLGEKITTLPDGFNIHPKLQRLISQRKEMLLSDPSKPSIDWGMGEMLAYATLSCSGTHVRLSGQDVRRGTFSHRHAIYVDQIDATHYFPLSHLSTGQAPCDIFNSFLSEYGVLGFEFGYSLLYPGSLVIWEAQFGDFSNGAQIVIDQYLATSEMKWGHTSNLTLLLPHGYEGMGPEHSSARLERFLQLCADENIQVVNCTTPAQLFHLLRRQALRALKKPLILFTPKALLRLPLCKSPLNAFADGQFEEILDDPCPPEKPKRLFLCSGKIYYDLLQMREKTQSGDLIVRIEQLYPLHTEKLKALIAKYPMLEKAYWVQEEHQNMGAWQHLSPQLKEILGKDLQYVGRNPAASPAAGSHVLHEMELDALIRQLYPLKNSGRD